MISRGRGAWVALVLSLAVTACFQPLATPTPAPGPLESPATLAKAAAALLTRLSAYDYALGGYFAGERAHVVTPSRYAAALRDDARAFAAFNGRVLQVAFSELPPRELLVLADACADLAGAVQQFAHAMDPEAFVQVVRRADLAWAALRALASTISDPELPPLIAHGTAVTVAISHTTVHAVVTAPDSKVVETHEDRAEAERRAAELRAAGTAAAVLEQNRYSFARSGPVPRVELWREPALDVATSAGARRGAFVSGGVAVTHDEGEVLAFDEVGRRRWRVQAPAAPSVAVANTDGKWLLVGGHVVQVIGSNGSVQESTRLTTAASDAIWFARREVFVVGSPGPTGLSEGGPGTVVALTADGRTVGAPFPLVTPAAGPAIAASSARDEIFVATTSSGIADVEVFRVGQSGRPRVATRVPGETVALAVDPDGATGVVVTNEGAFHFPLDGDDAPPQRLGDTPRAVRYGPGSIFYVLRANAVTAYDRAFKELWSAPLFDGRRLLVGKRVLVQDGLARLLLFDPQSGAADELANVGDVTDMAVSQEGNRVLVIADAARAVMYTLP